MHQITMKAGSDVSGIGVCGGLRPQYTVATAARAATSGDPIQSNPLATSTLGPNKSEETPQPACTRTQKPSREDVAIQYWQRPQDLAASASPEQSSATTSPPSACDTNAAVSTLPCAVEGVFEAAERFAHSFVNLAFEQVTSSIQEVLERNFPSQFPQSGGVGSHATTSTPERPAQLMQGVDESWLTVRGTIVKFADTLVQSIADFLNSALQNRFQTMKQE